MQAAIRLATAVINPVKVNVLDVLRILNIELKLIKCRALIYHLFSQEIAIPTGDLVVKVSVRVQKWKC